MHSRTTPAIMCMVLTEKRFGIVHVDFETLKRTPKSSYHAIAKALLKAG